MYKKLLKYQDSYESLREAISHNAFIKKSSPDAHDARWELN
jgi:hypothetical protein